MQKTVTSEKGTVNLRDILRSLVVAFLTAVFSILYSTLLPEDATFMDIKWMAVLKQGVTAAMGYLVMNVFSSSKIVVVNPDKQDLQAVKTGESDIRVLKVK